MSNSLNSIHIHQNSQKRMLYGACYYPEHWKRKDWRNHAQLMKQAGMNVVRTGDFAWKLMEPEDGIYDFSYLDDALDVLDEYGIKVILCTPTAGPPRWLAKKYDILQRDRYGRAENWGSRREGCANAPDYKRKSLEIARKMAEHFKEDKRVIAWQVDNEFGCHESTRCYCEHCRKAFAGYLEEKYGTIEKINDTWGLSFWSLQLDCFDDVILPVYNSCEPENAKSWTHNPSLDLEYRRFASDSWVRFQNEQVEIIRSITGKPVTHNFMGHFADLDYYNLAENLDFIEWDNYPDNQWGDSEYQYVSMAHEIMRGLKEKNFIVAEEQAGPAGWDQMGAAPEPGQIRLWVYQALAHGGDGMMFFRFKTPPFGMEQYWYGILDQDGIPRRRYQEIKQTGEELAVVGQYFMEEKTEYQALIVRTYDNVWAHEIKSHTRGFHYRDLLYQFYKANRDLNIQTAVSKGHYDRYKVVYMPAYNIVDEQELSDVTRFVENGGILVTTYRSGTRDHYNNLLTMTLPGAFRELAGIEVEEFDPLRKETHIDGVISSTAKVWCDIIKPLTAKVLCTYTDRFFAGKAAITENQYGKGKVYYIGCDLEQKALQELIRFISEQAGIEMVDIPEGTEVIERENTRVLLNHTDKAMQMPYDGISLFTGKQFDGLLMPYGVEILPKDRNKTGI